MLPIIFLTVLIVVIALLYRDAWRSRKLTKAIEEQRDLQTIMRVREIQQENDHLASQLTKENKENN